MTSRQKNNKKIVRPFNRKIAIVNEEGKIVDYRASTNPKRFNPETKEDIYNIIANGGTIKDIALKYKVADNTAWKWLTKDMPAYQDAMAARSSMRVEHMFTLVDDLIDQKIDHKTFKAIASAIQWCASKEGSYIYRDNPARKAGSTTVSANYLNFLEGEVKSNEVKEITNIKED